MLHLYAEAITRSVANIAVKTNLPGLKPFFSSRGCLYANDMNERMQQILFLHKLHYKIQNYHNSNFIQIIIVIVVDTGLQHLIKLDVYTL